MGPIPPEAMGIPRDVLFRIPIAGRRDWLLMLSKKNAGEINSLPQADGIPAEECLVELIKPSMTYTDPSERGPRSWGRSDRFAAPGAARACDPHRRRQAGCIRRCRRPGLRQACGSRSFLRQPRLAQSVERELQHRLVFKKPFDGEIGFETTRFSRGGFRFVHFALECVGGGQIEVGVEDAMAALDRLLGVFERFVETPEAE